MEHLIGTLAAILTTSAFVPQVVKVLRERQTAGISLGMYVLFTLGVGLWFVYGLYIRSLPVCLANGVTFGLACVVLWAKAREQSRRAG